MKKQMIKISSLLFVMVAMMLSACDDYLDDVPKGQKIPKTWEDYNAFIRNNFSYHFLDPDMGHRTKRILRIERKEYQTY